MSDDSNKKPDKLNDYLKKLESEVTAKQEKEAQEETERQQVKAAIAEKVKSAATAFQIAKEKADKAISAIAATLTKLGAPPVARTANCDASSAYNGPRNNTYSLAPLCEIEVYHVSQPKIIRSIIGVYKAIPRDDPSLDVKIVVQSIYNTDLIRHPVDIPVTSADIPTDIGNALQDCLQFILQKRGSTIHR